MRITGEGEPSPNGGPPGDCYCFISVLPHPLFERDGQHLICRVPITYAQAALGTTLEVPTLDGKVMLKVPAGTQTGKLFRMRGKGVKPVRGGPVGDLLCRVLVETPVNLTDAQKDLLREFDQTVQAGGNKHNPQSHSWMDGLKKFFENMKF